LDQEASEDEVYRASNSAAAAKNETVHPLSYEANKHLVSKANRYRETLEQARESDGIVRTKLDECEESIFLLSLDEVTIHT
jgi:hypothetical protein